MDGLFHCSVFDFASFEPSAGMALESTPALPSAGVRQKRTDHSQVHEELPFRGQSSYSSSFLKHTLQDTGCQPETVTISD